MSSSLASMVGLSATSNYSVVALPFYYVLALAPHIYASQVIGAGGKPSNYDNRNPRSTEHKERLQKRLTPAQFSRYERGRAAHANSLESFSVVAAAVILGNIARLNNADLNSYVVGIGILRVLYQIVYINTEKQKYTFIRSLLWFVMTGWSFQLVWKAGKVLM